MQQYNSIKAQYPDAMLLFRVGDFYETFGSDAVRAAKVLDIVLTKRANGSASEMELAGFPHHSLDTYLPKLVRAGMRVAICDQLEDPKATKTIVKRGVTELVTPGVTLNDKILTAKSNNFLASVHKQKDDFGLALLDISTGEFLIAEGKKEYIEKLLQSLRPSEVLFNKRKREDFISNFGEQWYVFGQEDWIFQFDFAHDLLLKHFGTHSLKGFGVENLEAAIIAAGSILHYLQETQHKNLDHVTSLSRIQEDKYVWMDRFTIRNLEMFQSNSPDGVSLADIIDRTVSPMGARMLKRWMALPLKDQAVIEQRLDVVSWLVENGLETSDIRDELRSVHDLERLVSKLTTRRIQPRELLQLQSALEASGRIKERLSAVANDALKALADGLNPLQSTIDRIRKSIATDAPALAIKGGVIAKGISAELDEYRELMQNGKSKLQEIQEREQAKTGIPSLKIAYNNVFGYYLEVRNTHKDKVPEEWIRKQTLVNAERYITEELKLYESKILGAEERAMQLEQSIYEKIVSECAEHVGPLQVNGQNLARLDCLTGFAELARKYKYVRPVFTENANLDIKDGRHPVIEQRLPVGQEYVANDVYLDNDNQQIIMITGPNMSGKSALLRQTALIVLLAQMGCYVPASAASIGLVDKIFVRVGASDNISQGESTFMVEMTETASILNNLSERSLVLLDEIGRGTSTYDGISIAWAIAEFLHEHPTKARTLFATHYHELNEMENLFARIKNFNVSVKEMKNQVIFLRKLQPGGSEHSFGLHVAGMAGMPKYVLNRAEKMLGQLEKSREQGRQNGGKTKKDEVQLSFFQLDDPLLEEIRTDIENLDINTLTPVEALMYLNSLQKKIK